MKAYVLHGIGDLRYEEVPIPSCPSEWGIVKVKAAGICSSDLPRIMTKGTYHFPTIPGHEFSGIVESVSEKKNQFLIGKKVGVFPLIPCHGCAQCKEGHYEMCGNYDYLGSRRDGGFAEYVAVPIWNMIELPKIIPYTSAAMLEPLSVALHSVKRAGNIQGRTISVIGTGMIGLAAASWANLKGAGEVYVIGRNEEKRQFVEQFPGITYINSFAESSPRTEIVIEAVGTSDAIGEAIDHVHPGGSVVLIGNPAGDIGLSQDVYWKILRKQIQLIGTWNSSYGDENTSDWIESVEMLTKGSINEAALITHIYEQDSLMDGLKLMEQHKEPYCKVMTVWND